MRGLEQYEVKILLALVKSVGGRTDFFKLLVTGGYPELAAFSNAIRGDDDAMVWLFKNDYAWLAILSNACDGDERAIDWVRNALTPVNLRFALACRHDVDSLRWLYKNHLELFLMLVREVEKFLDYQEKEYAWPYVMHFGGHYRAMKELEEWKAESGKMKVESRGVPPCTPGKWKEESGKWKEERGKWKEESGKRKVERGKWKVERGEMRNERGEMRN